MKTNIMATPFALHSLILLSTFTFFLSFQTEAGSTKLPGLVIELIHRDSIYSPFYNPHDTITDRAERMLRNSDARYAYLQAKSAASFESNIDVHLQANLNTNAHTFLVNFAIGEPPVTQFAIMDTGSSLTWVHCRPYLGPVFDPSKSSTYANMSCYEPSKCVKAISPAITCDEFLHICKYVIHYVSNSMSQGHMATETLTFRTSDDDTVVMNNIVFGCSHVENSLVQNDDYDEKIDGILGLGVVQEISIVHKLGNKFSYCIGNIWDRSYSFNQLAFGDEANVEGYSTPFEDSYGHYSVTLEGVSIGQKRIDIDGGVEVVIDSGTERNYLPLFVYNFVRHQVSSLLDGHLDPFVRGNLFCYKGDMSKDLQGFPMATFHLAEGADLVLDIESLFFEYIDYPEAAFCLSISPPPDNHVNPTSVIGIWAQQNYNVAYDLTQKRLYFQRIDCALLVD